MPGGMLADRALHLELDEAGEPTELDTVDSISISSTKP
jgi:hypothetical protein